MQHYLGNQCSIPVFKGLLPELFNGMLLWLLYKAAEWHALAKLRLHADSTLDLLGAVTRELSCLMQCFHDKTSDEFNTVELPHEAGVHKGGTHSSKKMKLNLNTYKFHALGDYVATIWLFRTMDSYSTQLVSSIPIASLHMSKLNLPQGKLAHRLVKWLYGLTNKKDAPEQIACRYRQANHFGASEYCDPLGGIPPDGDHMSQHNSIDNSPEFHHAITNSHNNPVAVASFSDMQDPAAKVGSLISQHKFPNISSRIFSPNFTSTSSVIS